MFYRKEDDCKDIVFSLLVAPTRLLAWIGFPLENILKSSFERARKPEISPVPLNFANKVLQSMGLIAEGVRFSITGEVYKSGPNKGKSKGYVKLHKGFMQMTENILMFYGIPEDIPRRFYRSWIEKRERKDFVDLIMLKPEEKKKRRIY